jgi:hypothetical protein
MKATAATPGGTPLTVSGRPGAARPIFKLGAVVNSKSLFKKYFRAAKTAAIDSANCPA